MQLSWSSQVLKLPPTNDGKGAAQRLQCSPLAVAGSLSCIENNLCDFSFELSYDFCSS